MSDRRCTKCGVVKPSSAFSSRGDGFGIRSACTGCSQITHESRKKKLTEQGRCARCGTKRKSVKRKHCAACLTVARETNNKYNRDPKNKEHLRTLRKDRQTRYKDAAYAAYGGYVCACCGITHVEFLSIDHVHGDGAAHRKIVKGTGTGMTLYVWLKSHDYPSGFRILCMNCNFALGHFGYCPHDKTTRSTHGTET